jgi:hypothetical protein
VISIKINHELLNGDDEVELTEEKLNEIIDVLQQAYTTEKIEVNDGERADGNREYEVVSTNDKNKRLAHLVLEEDDSVRFYFNPNEHSDFVITTIPVFYVELEDIVDEFDDIIGRFMHNNSIMPDDIEKLMIGWIDYKYSKMGELEKHLYKVIKDYNN